MHTIPMRILRDKAPGNFIQPLLRWYRQNARDLPWRQTHDPYAVWISEVMLQQTQVKTVIPYWLRWMRVFPDIRHLAKASEEQVLKLWEGLGYYARARNLRRAAQSIMNSHNGRFPQRYEEVLTLPGIGLYTAGAICSIGFNQPTPVLDGNVRRVLCRVFMLSGRKTSSRDLRELEQLTRALIRLVGLVRLRRQTIYGDWNQALMELGATLCAPRNPQCAPCPVRQFCRARQQNSVQKHPRPSTRRSKTRRLRWVFVVEHRNRYLVVRRSARTANAGLWEFPSALLDKEDCVADGIVCLALGFTPAWIEPVMDFSHTITNCRYQVRVFRGEMASPPPHPRSQERWLAVHVFRRLPFSGAHRRIIDRLFP